MPSLAIVRASNTLYSPPEIPVIVIFGGTAGIGEATTKALSRYTKGRAHIIIIGRNEAAGKAIIESLCQPEDDIHPNESRYEFISCDLNLMKNIHALTKDLVERIPKVNYLVLSAGVIGFGGREETEEGLDKKLAIRYYSRFAILNDLLPLLRKARDRGEASGVLSIMGAGIGPQADFNDLEQKKGYSGWKAMLLSIAYNDLMLEAFSKQEPDIAFTHIHPGSVDTVKLKNPVAKFLMGLLRPLIHIFVAIPEECAGFMVYALLNEERGFHRRAWNAEDIGLQAYPAATDEQKQVFWDHSVDAALTKPFIHS